MKKLVPILSASAVGGLALLGFAFANAAPSADSAPNASTSASAAPAPSSTSTKTPTPVTKGSASSKVSISPPSDVQISDVTTDSLKVSWSAPDNTVGKISKYSLLLKQNGSGVGTYETTDTSFSFNQLTSNTAYLVEVKAVAVSADGVNTATSVPAVSNTVVVRSPEVPEAPAATPSSAPEPSTASPTPSATVDPEAVKVAAVLTDFYNFVGSPDSLSKVKEAGKAYEANRTDEELKKLVTNFPEGFKYFDTSSSKSSSDAYNQLVARTTQSNRTGQTVKVTVPVEAIAIKDGKAVVDTAKLKVESKGNTTNGTEAPYFENPQIGFTKNADGSWVMVPEPPRQTIP